MGSSSSKLVMRQKIVSLGQNLVRPDDHEFWRPLFVTALSADDIFSLLEPKDIRGLREKQPLNLATLIFKCVEQLILFTNSKDPITDFTSAMNCIKILTRVLPFSFEHDRDNFVESVFWLNKPPVAAEGGSEIFAETIAGEPMRAPLGQLLVDCLVNALFVPGFTVPAVRGKPAAPVQSEHYPTVKSNLVWESGIASSRTAPGASAAIDTNRNDVLRCLITCFSQTLYMTSGECRKMPNKFLAHATSESLSHGPTIFFSLLNLVCNYNPSGILPYTSYLTNMRETLVGTAIQTLLVLLDYSPSVSMLNEERLQHNVHLRSLVTISRLEDFEYLFRGLVTLLTNPLQAVSTYLPGSQKLLPCHQELLVLLWKILDECKSFRTYVLTRADVNKLLIPVLYFLFEARKDQAKLGLIEVCAFILLLLSGEREFGIALNQPFSQKLPLDLPIFSGNHFDLLVIVLHKVIVTDQGWVRPLFDCFLTIISNISPYIKQTTMVASVRLLNLFEAFSSPKQLAHNERAHQLVFLLLETMNNLIQYQYEGNVNLVYTILRRASAFQRLWSLVTDDPSQSSPPTSPNSEQPDANAASSSHLQTVAHSEDGTPQQQQVASHSWSWRKHIPLSTTVRLCEIMVPELLKYCAGGVTNEDEVVQFLHKTTLVGLLPVPHPILIRKYQANEHTDAWITSFIWGVIYLRNMNPPLWDARGIKLFHVNVVYSNEASRPVDQQEAPQQQQPAAAAASSSSDQEKPEEPKNEEEIVAVEPPKQSEQEQVVQEETKAEESAPEKSPEEPAPEQSGEKAPEETTTEVESASVEELKVEAPAVDAPQAPAEETTSEETTESAAETAESN